MNKHTIEILQMMCDYVNVDYQLVDFTAKDWFMQHSWTEEKEQEFKEWLFSYMRTTPKARKELMHIPSNTKKMLNGWCSSFILNYGWKYA